MWLKSATVVSQWGKSGHFPLICSFFKHKLHLISLSPSCLAFAVTPFHFVCVCLCVRVCVCVCLCVWPLPWLCRYLPQGDHVFGRQSVQPPAGAGVLQEQPQPLLPLQPGGHALCPRVHKGRGTFRIKCMWRTVEGSVLGLFFFLFFFIMWIELKKKREKRKSVLRE